MHAGVLPAGGVGRVLGLPVLGLPMLPALPSMRLGLASLTRHLVLPISRSARLTRMLRREAAQAPNHAKTGQAVQLPVS